LSQTISKDILPGAAENDVKGRVTRFQKPILRSSIMQCFTSIGGYLAVCAAMYATAGISYWFVFALAPLAAGFLVRTFIIQHDCGHGSFFHLRRWNDRVGFVCSLFTLAPYLSWRRQHAGHHRVWNNLDRRDTGADIYSSCLTVDEYLSLSPWRRRWYRWSRSSIIANVILPPFVFLLLYRLPFDMPAGWRRERRAVYSTNLALIVLFGGAGIIFGFDHVATIHLSIMVLASIAGVWLFTVQHRSDRTVWARQSEWNATKASFEGATHLQLHPILQWFTGNIGLHHMHHLNSRIPNYRLKQAHDAIADLRDIQSLTLREAFKAMSSVLWDERRRCMATFREMAPIQTRITPGQSASN
jgi:omega-6 fatty acid desaturase (delta-12 desaturase)